MVRHSYTALSCVVLCPLIRCGIPVCKGCVMLLSRPYARGRAMVTYSLDYAQRVCDKFRDNNFLGFGGGAAFAHVILVEGRAACTGHASRFPIETAAFLGVPA